MWPEACYRCPSRLPAAGCGVRRHSGHYEDRLCRSGHSGRPWMSVRLHPPALRNGGLWSSARGTAFAKEDKSSSLSGAAPHCSRCLELTSECPRLNSTPSAGGPRWPSRDAGGRSPCAAQLRADGKGAPDDRQAQESRQLHHSDLHPRLQGQLTSTVLYCESLECNLLRLFNLLRWNFCFDRLTPLHSSFFPPDI